MNAEVEHFWFWICRNICFQTDTFLSLHRGDHTYAECFLTVVAKGTPCVVFSIDGSFTASVSIMGSDPKVRAGAVDVVR